MRTRLSQKKERMCLVSMCRRILDTLKFNTWLNLNSKDVFRFRLQKVLQLLQG